MKDVPQRWQAYLCLQNKLANNHRIDSRSWGCEAGLNALLESSDSPNQALDCIVASAARKHRYQVARLKREYEQTQDAAWQNFQTAGMVGPDFRALEAAQTLDRLESHVEPRDWRALVAVAMGNDYTDIAQEQGVSAGALRVRISRLRLRVLQLAA